jgi:hypothetical protein
MIKFIFAKNEPDILPFCDSLQSLEALLDKYQNACPPIFVSLAYPNGEMHEEEDHVIDGHCHIFFPKTSKKLHLPASSTVSDLLYYDVRQHDYRYFLVCDKNCPMCNPTDAASDADSDVSPPRPSSHQEPVRGADSFLQNRRVI